MPNGNYPFDQDTSFNSFTITDAKLVLAELGGHYNQSDLVPVSYPKIIARAITDVSIKWFPLQEFTYILDSVAYIDLNEETNNNIQGQLLNNALQELYLYWGTQLLKNAILPWATPLNAPLIVATPSKPQLVQDTIGGNFHLVLKFDIVTFVLPTSIYA